MKIYCDSSTKEACIVVEGQSPLIVPYRWTVTVNIGEYLAVIEALYLALALRLEQVEILTDSQLVVRQVQDRWKCRATHLKALRDKTRRLAQSFCSCQFVWIPREKNPAGGVLG